MHCYVTTDVKIIFLYQPHPIQQIVTIRLKYVFSLHFIYGGWATSQIFASEGSKTAHTVGLKDSLKLRFCFTLKKIFDTTVNVLFFKETEPQKFLISAHWYQKILEIVCFLKKNILLRIRIHLI